MTSSPRTVAVRSGPLWPPLLAGFLVAGCVLATVRRSVLENRVRPGLPHPEGAAPSSPGRLGRSERGFDQLTARELRRAPGVGQVRAAAIARARWERSGDDRPLRLVDLFGIGPATERRIHAWLASRGSGAPGISWGPRRAPPP